LEGITYDARVKLASRFPKPASTNLATLFLDDIAFRKLNDGSYGYHFIWPWPRFVHGQLIRELKAQGATAVGFDILFSEEYPREESTDQKLSNGETTSSDNFFAMQIGAASNVVLSAENDTLPAPAFAEKAYALGSIDSQSEYGVLRRVLPFTTLRVWNDRILALRKPLDLDLSRPDFQPGAIVFNSFQGGTNAVKLTRDGFLDLEALAAPDGTPPEKPFRMQRIWNLGIVLAAKSLELDLDKAEISANQIRFHGSNGLERVIPLDREGYLYIDWNLKWSDLSRGKTGVYPGTIGELLIQDKGRQDGETDLANPFRHRLVVVGSVATGNNITDKGATPLEEDTQLVTKHLNVANSLLMGVFVRRASTIVGVIAILFLGILSATFTWRTRVVTAISCVLLSALLYVSFCAWLYVQNRYWLPIVLPVGGGLFLPHFLMMTHRLAFEQREQRRIKAVFNKIVSPDVVQELLSAEKLALGGARRPVSIYFADVRGFTEFTDNTQATAEEYVRKNQLSPAEAEQYFDQQAAETLATVNLYLGTIADVIKKHQGTLDKYIGDCVMAFWGAPTPNPQHALTSVKAAIDAQRAMASLNQKRFAENERRKNENSNRAASNQALLPLLPILNLGSGVNSGTVTVGLMGSDDHILNYTVFGRDVNIASRLESVAKRGSIIISEETFQQLSQTGSELASICAELPPVTVKGIRQPIRIYEIQWKKSAGPTDVLTEDYNTVRFTKPSAPEKAQIPAKP
jgi:class 3 adenylate cyclase/CHASE2 domain-containing sensor protein